MVTPTGTGGASGSDAAVHVPAPMGAAVPVVPEQRRGRVRTAVSALQGVVGTGSPPARLRLAGLVVSLVTVLFGALLATSVYERQTAARDLAEQSAPLSVDAAEIYRSLADANATAAAGFLRGSKESHADRVAYQANIRTASRLLSRAAARTGDSFAAQRQITILNKELPGYTSLVEAARSANRENKPVGNSYMRYASEQMRSTMLPAAEDMYHAEIRRMAAIRADASEPPWAAYAAGLLALAVIGFFSYRLYLATNRIFNLGLVATAGMVLVSMAWLTAGHSVARSSLADSDTHGSASVQLLTQSRIAGLKARGNENMALVAQGEGAAYSREFDYWAGALDDRDAGQRLMQRSELQAEDEVGQELVADAWVELKDWKELHDEARRQDDLGDYDAALARTIGGKAGGKTVEDTTERSFAAMDRKLAAAVDHEQKQFQEQAENGRGALSGLPVGGPVLCLLGVAGAALGLGKRLAEYR
ncbi:hypothetical protein GCM10009802_46040 [Streptomyces synnematoformans]|uniref:Secreted protein n=1 Tax=Streptomyces synnematoformans TaxID=415721 RepID=A0ABN2Z5H7_9ACTN